MCFTSVYRSQNKFVYQLTLYKLLKKGKGIYYVLSWILKGIYTSKLKPLYTTFLHRIKCSGYRIGKNIYPLAVEQNNYLTKILNVSIVYDLDVWPRNPTENFKFKNCLLYSKK